MRWCLPLIVERSDSPVKTLSYGAVIFRLSGHACTFLICYASPLFGGNLLSHEIVFVYPIFNRCQPRGDRIREKKMKGNVIDLQLEWGQCYVPSSGKCLRNYWLILQEQNKLTSDIKVCWLLDICKHTLDCGKHSSVRERKPKKTIVLDKLLFVAPGSQRD